MVEQLLLQVKQNLESNKFDVETDHSYHGIKVSIKANSTKNNKNLFIYVLDNDRVLPVHILNLHEIKEGNNRIVRLPNCSYMILAPNGLVENAESISEQYHIPIFTDIEKFNEQISKYASDL